MNSVRIKTLYTEGSDAKKNDATLYKKADYKMIDEILHTAMRRKVTLFPDWEICYLALPKNDRENRREILVKMLELENSAADVQKSTPSIPKY